MTFSDTYNSPLGLIEIESDGEALSGLWLEGQKVFGDMFPGQYKERDLPIFNQTKKWLDIYFQGNEPDFTPPLLLEGTPFRKAVWNILLSIPYGKTMTYGEIAQIIAKQKGISRMSAQAVGGAVVHNPVSIIVPCHRVVGANGNLTGYTGGLNKKVKLLTIEKIDMSQFYLS